MAAKVIRTQPPLVVIVGPTASGKTALAIEMAERFGGEIICADSRTIYRGMDIGTAKPTPAEQARVPHWGLDLLEPSKTFNVADFKAYAVDKIVDIRSRGHIPFLVGGTGLYVDAVLFDYQFGPASDPKKRRVFEDMSLEQLHKYCTINNVILPENSKNKRYVIRAIERNQINIRRRRTPLRNSIVVGISTDNDILRSRIRERAEQLFKDGVVKESIILGKKYGWSSQAMTGNIYPLVQAYLNNELTLHEAKEKFTILDWRLAKRQMTWLRRNPYIEWGTLTEIKNRLSTLLASY